MQFMGPFTQMDKSTIQGLSFDEYTSLCRYYYHVITPILLRELSSMLAKKYRNKKSSYLLLFLFPMYLNKKQ